MRNIRNFSIIAHIDHGKSTLSDRLIEMCGGLEKREMSAQVLDSMDIERERGITIKAQSVSLNYAAPDGETYALNFIDTPGHVDFSYEVSRSLAACEGALLVVDAAQGVEAQSIANCYTAVDLGLEIVPVLNKIDLPSAEPDRVRGDIEEIIGLDTTDCVQVSAKTGQGMDELLDVLVRRIPPADRCGRRTIASTDYRFLVRQLRRCGFADPNRHGELPAGKKIVIMSSGDTFLANDVGGFYPENDEPQNPADGRSGLCRRRGQGY